ncbi:MAG: pyroglutamyl-peptidase I [Anaerolineaceae bacterium]
MKFLITGFEPFHEHPVNPSQLLVENLPDQYLDVQLVKGILPVHHLLGPERLLSLLADNQPDAILAFGLAANRTKISLERVAINLMDFSIADNAGVTVTNQPIDPNGPAAYFSTLPVEQLLSTLVDEEIPTEISLSAGAYLCNQVFYALMHWVAAQNKHISAGFIHLPALPEQAARSPKPMPSLPLDYFTRAALLIIDTIILHT